MTLQYTLIQYEHQRDTQTDTQTYTHPARFGRLSDKNALQNLLYQS